jgi:hypothetical protein
MRRSPFGHGALEVVAMFRIIENGEVAYADPKLEAYKYMAMLQRLGKHTGLCCFDGKYRVEADGCEPITFVKEK